MRPGVAMAVLAWSAVARADDASVSEHTEQVEIEAPPEQRYGFSVRPRVEHIDGKRAQIELTDAASIFVTGTWSSSDREERLREDDPGHEWTAGAGASIDLGWAQLDAHATYGRVENELGVGAYLDVGVGLRKTFRITDTVTGFLSLTFGERRWRGDPLPGESDASTVMLSFGLRWR